MKRVFLWILTFQMVFAACNKEVEMSFTYPDKTTFCPAAGMTADRVASHTKAIFASIFIYSYLQQE